MIGVRVYLRKVPGKTIRQTKEARDPPHQPTRRERLMGHLLGSAVGMAIIVTMMTVIWHYRG